jgi:hypothetical protein
MSERRNTARRTRSLAQKWTEKSRSFVHEQLGALADRLPALPAKSLRRLDSALGDFEKRVDRANADGLARYRRFEHRVRSELASRIRELERAVAKAGRRSASA